MSQQPYAPQYPQPPVQGYPQQPVQQPYPAQYPAAPAQAYPPQPQQYGAPQAPQAPTQPLAQGSIDDFYNQPSVGGGPSLSWTDKNTNQPKPIGTSYAGIVARDVTNADVQQQTDFRTQAPLFYKDGRPKFAMKVPLKLQPSAEFPDGEASWFVKGQARDELVRAMAEAGCSGSPTAGAVIEVTLVQRRNTGAGMNPANIVQVRYTPPAGTGAPSPAPVQQQVPVQQAALAPQPQAQPAPEQTYQQPVQAQPAWSEQPQAQPVQQAVAQPAPQAPAGLSPEQQQLLAQLTGGGQAPAGQ
ncbi:hypothetical protein [Nocardioides sp. 503]|uniref:hypothetical protein n=1 Tax=Nocardioides sp. 503 TaxID=2508326 RepID=UPI00106F34F5|nr:hypothetical protein [Nocardioides sp. 503]